MTTCHKYSNILIVAKCHNYYFCGMDIRNFVEEGGKNYLPNLSIDHVIMGYEEEKLKCLLLRFGDKWALPGGFVQRSETVEQATLRILRERTGLEKPFLRFLSVFGNEDRKFTEQWKEITKAFGIPWKDTYWINDRFVTLANYSLVNSNAITPEAGWGIDEIAWIDFDHLPAMWMDHTSIASFARNQLKADIQKETIAYHLLPSEFTMPQLHQLHQVILKEKIDRSRFQKKMLSTELFERLPHLQKETPGRNPYLYRWKNN